MVFIIIMDSKMTINKVLSKSFIVWGIKYNETIKIFYKWKLCNKDYDTINKLDDFVILDYDKYKREWYVTYIHGNKLLSCTIDDINGSYSITSF